MQLGLLEDFHFFMRKCISFGFILLYQRTFYLLFLINYFLNCIAFHSYWVCIHRNEMYKTKLPLFASKEKHVGKNTIYSYTRTLISQKTFPNLRLTDKTFFFWLTPCYFWLTPCVALSKFNWGGGWSPHPRPPSVRHIGGATVNCHNTARV
jgi:hypothetical protein